MEPSQQQQTVAVQQQPMVTVQPETSVSNGVRSRGNWKGLRITGYLQVILGVISVLLGILAIVFHTHIYFVGYAVWMGICFYIVAGILGIASGGKQKTGVVAGYLIMSIIAAVCACAMIAMAGVNINSDRHICPDWMYHNIDYDLASRVGCSSSEGSRLAIDALVLVVGVAVLVVSVVGASLTCSSLCCYPSPSYPMVYYQSAPQVVAAGQPAVQYAFVPQQQQQFVPQQQQQFVPQQQQQFVPQQQFVQQPQFGNVMYPGQPIIVTPAQPLQQPQGQVQYQTTPQGTAPPQAQTQAEAPPGYTPTEPTSKTSNLPEDHHSKPLIT
ncbi:membrane-spanning 4-domains subfamily A member 8-like [Patiria miniata]|uniref:Uncharacterized protein n=1 Tax=Patiria miniata TaxID=46514 RepID=A0A913ZLL4_PATMI|nr:membrane-spanning 4-domains subfamily A member 8-like [Patiria miniata]